jgi:putative membrane protein
MQLVHASYSRWRKQFARDENRHTEKFYRIMNEVPAVILIGILILVVVKPF